MKYVKMKEEKLVALCKKQKSSAQKEVYNLYAPLLRGVCRRYVIDFDNAEDVLQEGFFRVFMYIEKFTWNGNGSLFYWSKRIMINTAINYLRKHSKKIQEEPISEKHEYSISDNSDDFFSSEAKYSQDDIRKAFEKVSDQFRVVLNLYIIDGMKHKEIAEMLEIPEETSRSRLGRGKKMLRDLLIQIHENKTENIYR